MNTPPLLLIIDDDARVTESLRRGFEARKTFAVVTASCGNDGLALAKKVLPQAILLDVLMPGVAGGEVAERLAESAATRDIPIVFLTGLMTKEEAKGKVIGGRRYLAKPASLEDIEDAVREALGKA